MKTPFLGGAYLSRSKNLNAQRCVNLYAETTENGRDVGAFFNAPGLASWLDLGTSAPIIGGIVAAGYLWGVSNSRLYRIAQDKTKTDVGEVLSAGRVQMAYNGTEIGIATGSTGRLVNVAAASISDMPSPAGAKTIAVVDGYFLCEEPGTGRFFQSGLRDGTSWNALAFGTKEGAPDPLMACIADHRELWLFGSETTEVWHDAGTSPLAFARTDGAYFEHGVVSPYAVGKIDGLVAWLSNDRNGGPAVFAAQAYQPARISTPALDQALAGYTLSEAFCWTYQQEGHSWLCFTFPDDGVTWAYDASTKLWFERAYMDASGNLTRHRANCVFQFDGKTLVGDFENGKLYHLDLDTLTDDGAEIKRLRTWGHVHNNTDRVQFNELTLVAETGVGLDGTAQGSNPQVMLRWSDDGGHTFKNEHWRDLGKIGKKQTRVSWRRMGMSRDRVFELSMTDPVKVAWIGAELDAEPVK